MKKPIKKVRREGPLNEGTLRLIQEIANSRWNLFDPLERILQLEKQYNLKDDDAKLK